MHICNMSVITAQNVYRSYINHLLVNYRKSSFHKVVNKHTRCFWFMLGITRYSLELLTSHCYRRKQIWISTLLKVTTIPRVDIRTVVILGTVRWMWLQRCRIGSTKTVYVCCKSNKYHKL